MIYRFLCLNKSCMNLVSEVILRQKDRLTGRILLVNPEADDLYQYLSDECEVWTWNYADYLYFQAKQVPCYFSIYFPTEKQYDTIVIANPKAKKRLEYALQAILENIEAHTQIYLAGEKKAGIEGAAKVLQSFGKCSKIDSARHCQVWQLYPNLDQNVLNIQDWISSYEIQCGTDKLTIYAYAGVFSQNKLDIGTAQLLPFLSQVKSGKIADFGCGAGIITAYLARLQPHSEIYAYDVDVFALESTKLTCEKNQLNQVNVVAVKGIDDIKQGFDAIVTNPPFHQGVKTDYQVSERLCHTAKLHLAEKGEMWLVANRFLNYPTILQQYFKCCEIKADTNGFKVIYVS